MPLVLQPFSAIQSSPPLGRWQVTTLPADSRSPLTPQLVAQHLRIDPTADDAACLDAYMRAAVDYAEDALAMSLSRRTITAWFTAQDIGPVGEWGLGCPPGLLLPRGPVISVMSVADGNATSLANRLDHGSGGARIVVTGRVTAYPLTVVYTAGYANKEDVPPAILGALLAHVGTLYENRESVGPDKKIIPHSLEAFYRLKSRRTPVG